MDEPVNSEFPYAYAYYTDSSCSIEAMHETPPIVHTEDYVGSNFGGEEEEHEDSGDDWWEEEEEDIPVEKTFNECYLLSETNIFEFKDLEENDDGTELSELSPSEWVIIGAWEEDEHHCEDNEIDYLSYAIALEVNTCHVVNGSYAFMTDGTNYYYYEEDNCDGSA